MKKKKKKDSYMKSLLDLHLLNFKKKNHEKLLKIILKETTIGWFVKF